MAAHLPTPQLSDVMEELSVVRAKWRLIGYKLNIDTASLDAIAAQHQHQDIMHNLMGVLEECYRHVHPSWGLIVKILRSNTLDETMLASAIETKYCKAICETPPPPPPPPPPIDCLSPNSPSSNGSASEALPSLSTVKSPFWFRGNSEETQIVPASLGTPQQCAKGIPLMIPTIGDHSGLLGQSDGFPQLKEPQHLVSMSWQRDFEWELPFEMIRPHIVRIGSDIYFGGECGKGSDRGEICKFSLTESQWCSVCSCPTTRFGLTELNGKLITVGGLENDVPSSCVYCLDGFETWKEMPHLKIARSDVCAVSYNSNLIAIGGITRRDDPCIIESTNTIEILAKDSPAWKVVSWVLPVPLYSLSYAIISKTLYILGGCKCVQVTADAFFISLPSLLGFAPRRSLLELHKLPSCPFGGSTAAVVYGKLLSIGGQCSLTQCTTNEVYAYSSSDDEWERVPTNLPAPRLLSSVVQLDDSRIVLVGGCEKQGDIKKTAFVN